MKKKIFTFTNFMILFTIIVYILNLFVISPDTGSMALSIKEVLTDSGIDIPNPIFFQIFGVHKSIPPI